MIYRIIKIFSIQEFILNLPRTAAAIWLPYRWAATIFGPIFELSTHKNLPIDTSQAPYKHQTLGYSQLLKAASSR